MSDAVENNKFYLDGRELVFEPGETILEASNRAGEEIPHLCTDPRPGYKPGGNCRACMVEIEGERALAPSCSRVLEPGMQIRSSASERAQNSRKVVMELLLSDQPERSRAHDRNSRFWQWAEHLDLHASRFPARDFAQVDR